MSSPLIPFNDFQREPEILIQNQLRAVEGVLRSGWWILGPQVKAFEEAWSEQCSTQGTVGVANGLDAIEIGLRALGIGHGDEVITSALTAFATTLAIQRCGAIPVFADIDPTTACLDPDSVERCIGNSTRAVLVVHLYGRSADLNALEAICGMHDLFLLEDCAQAHGAMYKSRPVGSAGDFGAWSFYPTKNLGAVGDGGALTSNNVELLERARQIRNYGQRDRYFHDLEGLNSRLDELQAALLLQRMKFLKTWTNRRREIAKLYWQNIRNPDLELLKNPSDSTSHVHHLFVALTSRRSHFLAKLEQQGVASLMHYPIPCHWQKAIRSFRTDPSGLPFTERHSSSCISLPIHPYLTDQEVSRVIDACNSVI